MKSILSEIFESDTDRFEKMGTEEVLEELNTAKKAFVYHKENNISGKKQHFESRLKMTLELINKCSNDDVSSEYYDEVHSLFNYALQKSESEINWLKYKVKKVDEAIKMLKESNEG